MITWMSDPGNLAHLTVGPGISGGNATNDTTSIMGTDLKATPANIRPVGNEFYTTVDPGTAPGVLTDFHGVDEQLAIVNNTSLVNSNSSLYAFEAKAYHSGNQTINNLIAGLCESDIQGTGTAANVVSLKTEQQILSGGQAANVWGLYVLAPIVDGTSNITTQAVGLFVTGYNATNIGARAVSPFAIYVHDGISLFNDIVKITNVFTAGVGLTVNSTNATNSGQFAATFQGYDYGISVTVSQTASAGAAKQIIYAANLAGQVFVVEDVGSVIVSTGAALANAAVDGFLYIPTVVGAPTGVPTTRAGGAAMVFDTTNNKIWLYNGSWKGVVIA